MSVSSVLGSGAAYASTVQRSSVAQTQTFTEVMPDREQDGDQDDSVVSAASVAPTTNMQGQAIGSLINAVA